MFLGVRVVAIAVFIIARSGELELFTIGRDVSRLLCCLHSSVYVYLFMLSPVLYLIVDASGAPGLISFWTKLFQVGVAGMAQAWRLSCAPRRCCSGALRTRSLTASQSTSVMSSGAFVIAGIGGI